MLARCWSWGSPTDWVIRRNKRLLIVHEVLALPQLLGGDLPRQGVEAIAFVDLPI